MSERKAMTLVMIAVVILPPGACGVVMALTGSTEFAAAAMLAVLGLGVDQMSRLMMKYDRR
jgi:hypothetical protein